MLGTQQVKEALAVFTEGVCFLHQVLQIGPADGPADSHHAAGEFYTSAGRGRLEKQWQTYVDKFFVSAGRRAGGRALTGNQLEARPEGNAPRARESGPLAMALQAAGSPTGMPHHCRIRPVLFARWLGHLAVARR